MVMSNVYRLVDIVDEYLQMPEFLKTHELFNTNGSVLWKKAIPWRGAYAAEWWLTAWHNNSLTEGQECLYYFLNSVINPFFNTHISMTPQVFFVSGLPGAKTRFVFCLLKDHYFSSKMMKVSGQEAQEWWDGKKSELIEGSKTEKKVIYNELTKLFTARAKSLPQYQSLYISKGVEETMNFSHGMANLTTKASKLAVLAKEFEECCIDRSANKKAFKELTASYRKLSREWHDLERKPFSLIGASGEATKRKVNAAISGSPLSLDKNTEK